MNLQQAKITLEKINRLYQSMTLDSKIDIHEQELMLSYIRQFYRSFSGNSEELVGTVASTKVIRDTSATTVKETPKRVVKTEVPVTKTVPVVTTPPQPVAPPSTPEPVVVKSTFPEPVVKVEEPQVVIPAAKPEVSKPPAPIPTPTPPPTPSVAKPAPINEEFEVLFEHKEAKELSDKLAQSPIRDLTKAISINEKILTVQELFDKNNQAYSDAIGKLNGYSSFEQAKPLLAELAHQYKWTTKGRKKKAKVFITLIRRRYK